MSVRIAFSLGVQAQLVAHRARHRHADQPATLLGHEVDRLGCDVLREHHEVPLVLPVGVVDEDDHAPLAQVFEDLGDGADGHGTGGFGRDRRDRAS